MQESPLTPAVPERWLLTVKLTPIGLAAYRAPGADARVGPVIFGNRMLACSEAEALKEADALVSALRRIPAGGATEVHAFRAFSSAPSMELPFRETKVPVKVEIHYWVIGESPMGAVKLYRQVRAA